MAKLPEQFKKHTQWLRESTRQSIKQYEEVAHMLNLLTYLKAYPRFSHLDPSISDWLDNGRPKLTIRVKSFPETLPVLEQLADWGCDFNRTADQLTWGDRLYYSDKCVVEAHLVEGSDECKRVIIGYKQVEPQPIYKFDCGPDQTLPPVNPNPLPDEVVEGQAENII
jgi:hypothetical protein